MTETIIIGRKPRRSRPPTTVRPPTEAGQQTGPIVVATGQETSASVGVGDVLSVDADLSSVTDAIDDLMAVIRVHERTDGAASSAPSDIWGPTEAYFVRTADDGDTTAAPDNLRIQIYRHYGTNTGYTLNIDWAVFSNATSATIASGQKSTAAVGDQEYQFSIPVSTTVGMKDIVPLVRVHQGRDGYDDALAAPVWVVADAMFTRSDGDTTPTLPPENFVFRAYAEEGTETGTLYVDYLLLDGTQGGLLESATTSAADADDGKVPPSTGYFDFDFSPAPTSGQGSLILWIRSHENLDGATGPGSNYIRPANYLFDNDPDDTSSATVPDGVAMFRRASTGTYRHTAYALSDSAAIAGIDPEVAAYSHTHTESDVTDLDHWTEVDHDALDHTGLTGVGSGGSSTGGTYALLGEDYLTSDTANVEVSSISGNSKDLKVVALLRSDNAAEFDNLVIRVGSSTIDTGSNYAWHREYDGSSTGADNSESDTAMTTDGGVSAANADASEFATLEMVFHDYAATDRHKLVSWVVKHHRATTYFVMHGWGRWKSNSAIDIIQLSPETGSNWVAGSYMRVYGMAGYAVPEWVSYLAARQSDETANSDTADDFFDDETLDAAWTTLTVSGAQAITEARDLLSIAITTGQSISDVNALLRPVSPSVGDMIETRARGMVNDQGTNKYLMVGLVFADGTTAGSNAAVFMLHRDNTEESWYLSDRTGTFTAMGSGAAGFNNDRLRLVEAPYLRLEYDAANTWRAWLSPDGVSWRDLGTFSDTLTPTHVGLIWSTWGDAAEIATVTYEYFRYIAA